jgi:cellulose synthase (UDP-forming)
MRERTGEQLHDREHVKDWVRRAVCLTAAAVGVDDIVWRLVCTLNGQALWFAIPLWGAEACGLRSSLLCCSTVWDTRSRAAPATPKAGLAVDIFIPTYNEPMWMLASW